MPWWASALIASLLLAVVLFIVYSLAHPYLPTNKPYVLSPTDPMGKFLRE